MDFLYSESSSLLTHHIEIQGRLLRAVITPKITTP